MSEGAVEWTLLASDDVDWCVGTGLGLRTRCGTPRQLLRRPCKLVAVRFVSSWPVSQWRRKSVLDSSPWIPKR